MKKFLKQSKKIFFFCPSIEEGGVEKNLINISNKLCKDIQLYIITANNDKKKFFDKRIKFLSTNKSFFNKKSRILKSLVCFFLLFKNTTSKHDVVVSFQSNIFAIIYCKILGCKIIIRPNAAPNFYAKNLFKKILMSFLYKFANKIFVNSQDFQREFKKYFNLNSVLIYNSVEDKFKIQLNYNKKINFNFFKNDKKSLKIISVGRLVEQKDHITILKALNLIKKTKKFKFCLIGKGDEKYKLLKFIKKNNLTSFVKLVGYKKNVYPYYKAADLFILSSIYEGSPNVLIEALTTGIQIISSNCKTGPREILKKKKYGKLFNIKDYKSLSKLILKTRKRNNKFFIKDKRFDINNNITKYKNLINSV